jgi:hypothetical protein
MWRLARSDAAICRIAFCGPIGYRFRKFDGIAADRARSWPSPARLADFPSVLDSVPFAMKNRMILKSLIFTVMSALVAQTAAAANIGIDQAWARATMPGQPVGVVYMVIETDADARLVGVSSPVAARVEMHEMKMDGGVMRMREMEGGIELPKGQAVTLKPGGLHLMLMDLKQPIAPGETIPLTLILESNGKQQTIEVRAQGRAVGGAMPHVQHH